MRLFPEGYFGKAFNKKAKVEPTFAFCRDEVTRTPGLHVPNVARYPTVLHPELLGRQRYLFFAEKR
jgi:hypothetical protein